MVCPKESHQGLGEGEDGFILKPNAGEVPPTSPDGFEKPKVVIAPAVHTGIFPMGEKAEETAHLGHA